MKTLDIITNLYPNHTEFVGQIIMYLWYKLNKKANIYYKCKNIIKYLDIIEVNKKIYSLKSKYNINFIKITQVPELDFYGIVADSKKSTILLIDLHIYLSNLIRTDTLLKRLRNRYAKNDICYFKLSYIIRFIIFTLT